MSLKPVQLGKNSTAVVKIQELVICEIQFLICMVCGPFARENLVGHIK